jgi:hypothetical protein
MNSQATSKQQILDADPQRKAKRTTREKDSSQELKLNVNTGKLGDSGLDFNSSMGSPEMQPARNQSLPKLAGDGANQSGLKGADSFADASRAGDRAQHRGKFGGITKPVIMFFSPQPTREYEYKNAVNLRVVKELENTVIVGKGIKPGLLSGKFVKSKLFLDLQKLYEKDPVNLEKTFLNIKEENNRLKEELTKLKKQYCQVPAAVGKTKIMTEIMTMFKEDPEKLGRTSLSDLETRVDLLESELEKVNTNADGPATVLCQNCKVFVKWDTMDQNSDDENYESGKPKGKRTIDEMKAYKENLNNRKNLDTDNSSMGSPEKISKVRLGDSVVDSMQDSSFDFKIDAFKKKEESNTVGTPQKEKISSVNDLRQRLISQGEIETSGTADTKAIKMVSGKAPPPLLANRLRKQSEGLTIEVKSEIGTSKIESIAKAISEAKSSDCPLLLPLGSSPIKPSMGVGELREKV